MENGSELSEVLRQAADAWPSIGGGDPNTFDVCWCAWKASELVGLDFPTDLPDRETSRKIVEIVESNFIAGEIIRNRPSKEIAQRAVDVIDDIEQKSLLSFGGIRALVEALFMWHGCLCMAKSLRPTHLTSEGEDPYTLELRKRGYAALEEQWRTADNPNNQGVLSSDF